MEELPIYFEDLTEKAQQKVLEFYGISDIQEGNFDLVPLCYIAKEE